MGKTLRRYTEIPFLLESLHSKEISLLNPSSWDDKNDIHYLANYAEKMNFESIYALCMTEAKETYHHWKIFSHGSSGICVEFYKDLFIEYIEENIEVKADSVDYRAIKTLKTTTLKIDELPFVKRQAFRDEKEYRLFVGTKENQKQVYKIDFPIDAVKKIILSPWLPKTTAKIIRETITQIPGCENIKVTKSTLVDNKLWKSFAVEEPLNNSV